MDKLKKKPLSFIKFVVILLFISVASALIYREFFKKEKEEVKEIEKFIYEILNNDLSTENRTQNF